MRIGLLGMGEMGFAFARRLIAQGHQVVGYDPDPSRSESARNAGVTAASSPAEVARCADSVVILIVQTQAHAENACLGPDGCLGQIDTKVLVVMSSLNPEFVQQLEGQTEALGGHLVDATVGSGAGDALKGSMLVMVSGKPQARVLAEPVLGELADRPEVVGDHVGEAQVMKLITQVAMGVNMAGAVESIRIANHFGLDLADTLRVVGRSPGASYISANWQFLTEVIKSHNVENIHKDLRALISRGIEGDLETPVAAAAMYSLRHDWPVADGAVAVAGQGR
jgi:3-hydroxyisobutyrate dehydrogenase-like beta-hydroxyacid dehydrogenase